jgi:hypothetical protein
MAVLAVTPTAGTNTFIAVGGSAVQAAPTNPVGGFITNPLLASDQGVSGDPEPLYVDPVGLCGSLSASGTIFALAPGQTWPLIAGQTTATFVNAATSGHQFSVVWW